MNIEQMQRKINIKKNLWSRDLEITLAFNLYEIL